MYIYADDLVLLSPSAAGLSLLLSACSYYGIEFDVKYNSAKSNVMVFCSNLFQDIPVRNFMLNGVAIDKVSNYTYRGTLVYGHLTSIISSTRQVTCATHVRNHVCPRVELILKIIIILLIIFLGFFKSKPC